MRGWGGGGGGGGGGDIMNAFIRTLRLLSDNNLQGLARAFNFKLLKLPANSPWVNTSIEEYSCDGSG